MLIGISCAFAAAAAICCIIFGYYWIAVCCILLEAIVILGILLYRAKQEAEVYFVGDFDEKEQKEIDILVFHLYGLTYKEVLTIDPKFEINKDSYMNI